MPDEKKANLKPFIAYLEHIGYLKSLSSETTNYEARKYELPIVFQKIARKYPQCK